MAPSKKCIVGLVWFGLVGGIFVWNVCCVAKESFLGEGLALLMDCWN